MNILKIIGEDLNTFLGLSDPISFADDNFYLLPGFGNSGVVETEEGLIIFDIGLRQFGKKLFDRVRKISKNQIKYIIYSHGHFDHCFGYKHFISEIQHQKWDMPEIIAHKNLLNRFNKYKMLDEYHAWLNAQQFSSLIRDKSKVIKTETLDPTILIDDDDEYNFSLGGYTFEIFPEWGETDDAIWMYNPEQKVIFSGDLMVSSFPNIGNPYKVQRYPKRWALALERMLTKDAEYLLPGHGKLIVGKDKIQEVLSITAEALHFVHDEVVKRLNQGKWFEEIYHEMLEIYPEKFKNHKYLRPVYGCYEFAIHSVYRLYHGWYDSGNPTDLFPARTSDISSEILKIFGHDNEKRILDHAIKLKNEGKLQLSLHILDIIIEATEVDKKLLVDAYKIKRKILKGMVKEESSFIGQNILNNEAHRIKKRINKLRKKS
ncbi:MAG: MBL fold metallo-hydrolase [Candidatus Lokiarchaeota archaeon]|nr:MBL fold metallo-hydrolase [Candidatus Lokiarchaeota archaeon]